MRAAEPGLHVIAGPDDSRPFLLAGVSQRGLIRRYRRSAAICFAAFLAAGAVLAWMPEARGWF